MNRLKLLACLLSLSVACADTTTSRLSLTIPDIGGTGWGTKLNTNFSTIDSSVGSLSGTNAFTGSNSFTSPVLFRAQNSARFYDPSNIYYVELKAATTLFGNVSWKLPATDGSANNALLTNGSGSLSFSTIPILSANQIWTGTNNFDAVMGAGLLTGYGGGAVTTGVGAGATSGGLVTLNGTGTIGQFVVSTGTGPVTTGIVGVVTPARAATTKIVCTITPATVTTLAISSNTFVTGTDTTWTVNVTNSALAKSAAYIWNFVCGGY